MFEPSPRGIDCQLALSGIAREAEALRDRLLEVSADEWASKVVVGEDEVDGHWICRHAVHDPTHHLLDVERLRSALADGP